ncbi:MAG: hypothetical protein QY322_04325 [bacterium]|nr:MAG: hypothetical protein QY322_04325 [bacterium]
MKKRLKKINKVKLVPNYNPKAVIEIRGYGIVELKKYQEKIIKNILVFKEAIQKEKNEHQRVQEMIKVLEKDIKTAKKFL